MRRERLGEDGSGADLRRVLGRRRWNQSNELKSKRPQYSTIHIVQYRALILSLTCLMGTVMPSGLVYRVIFAGGWVVASVIFLVGLMKKDEPE